MPVPFVEDHPWTRKHDKPSVSRFDSVPRIYYPRSLAELIEICRDHRDHGLHAAGSHWALSEAAFSDHGFIETHDPRGAREAMGRTLPNVVPGCLSTQYLELIDKVTKDGGTPRNLIHVEAGKRVHQLYAELDQPVDLNNPNTLGGYMHRLYGNSLFGGSWAPRTLGGAGGQTIVGALTTGTHGGDFDRPPIADSVVALHLVADGGKHYWIEPESRLPLTDDYKLRQEYGKAEFGGPNNFEIIRERQLFEAVLVSVGRFGVIYSVVLSAVRQHHIYERRRLHVWQNIKHDIKNRSGPLFQDAPQGWDPDKFTPSSPPVSNQRFLQIVVCLTPHLNFQRNLVGITKRWNINTLPAVPFGRAERVGDIVRQHDPILNAPRFSKAGRSYPFTYDPSESNSSGDPSLLERACSSGSFMIGLLEQILNELEDFITSAGGIVGTTALNIVAPGAGGVVLLIPALKALLPLLKELAEALGIDDTLGDVMNQLRELLLDGSNDPAKKAAGIFVWQMIAYQVFTFMQGDKDREGVSYAIMDGHHYLQQSCEEDVDSVEVFFDAKDDRLITFIDALLQFEMMQEFAGKAFLGYASMRFTGPTRALLGEQLWETTCCVEVACLRDMKGSQELVDYAVQIALNPNIKGLLHWGQRNDYTRAHVEARYGARLVAWRQALSRITDQGRLNAFSNDFTRRTGLEVI